MDKLSWKSAGSCCLVLAVVLGFYLLMPLKINLRAEQEVIGGLVEVRDGNNRTIESRVIDKMMQIKRFDLLKLILESGTFNVFHPLYKHLERKLGWELFIVNSLELKLNCWCADKTYPAQQDLTKVYAHFNEIKNHYIANVKLAKRRQAVAGQSKALYMLIAVASDRVGEGRKLHKREVRQKKSEMTEAIRLLYTK